MLPVVRVDDGGWPDVFAALREAGFESWAMTPAADAANIWDLDPPNAWRSCSGQRGPVSARRSLAAADRRCASRCATASTR